jgi:hypothetical protein
MSDSFDEFSQPSHVVVIIKLNYIMAADVSVLCNKEIAISETNLTSIEHLSLNHYCTVY